MCSSLGIQFDTKACHEIPGFSPGVPGGRTAWRGSMERWSSSLPTSRQSPARAQFPEKVSLGLRASYHSSEPPGAAQCRTHFISISEQTVLPRGGLKSNPGAELCPARHPCEPSGVQSDRVWTCMKVVFNTSRLVWLWGRLGRRTGCAVDTSTGFGSGQPTLSHPPAAPFLCVDCLCYSH